MADYTKAIEIAPGFADAYYKRGETYETYNSNDELIKAVNDWKKASELNLVYSDMLKDKIHTAESKINEFKLKNPK